MSALSLRNLLKEAWPLLKGAKAAFALITLALAMAEAVLFLIKLEMNTQFDNHFIAMFIVYIIGLIVVPPFMGGYAMLGLTRARGEAVHLKDGFAYFRKMPSLFITALLMYLSYIVLELLLAGGGFLFFLALHHLHLLDTPALRYLMGGLFIFIYLFCFIGLFTLFSFSLLFLLDGHRSPWSAVLSSIKCASSRFKTLFSLLFLIEILPLVFALSLVGLQLFWSLPSAVIIAGSILGVICVVIDLFWLLPLYSISIGLAYRFLTRTASE